MNILSVQLLNYNLTQLKLIKYTTESNKKYVMNTKNSNIVQNIGLNTYDLIQVFYNIYTCNKSNIVIKLIKNIDYSRLTHNFCIDKLLF